MLVKRFNARTCSQALAQVRENLGESAAILETRRHEGGVEVVAAAERPAAERPNTTAARNASAPLSSVGEQMSWLVEALEHRGFSLILAERIAAAAQANLDPESHQDEAVVFDYARNLLTLWIGSDSGASRHETPTRILVGPPGVGKTCTTAKLAAREVLTGGKKVVLATMDNRRLGGAEQIESYARVLDVPFHVIRRREDLLSARDDAGESGRLFVDSPGISRGEDQAMAQLGELIEGVGREEIELLLAADHDVESLSESLQRFRRLGVGSVGATRTDEAIRRGCLVTALARGRLPLCHVGNGPEIPDDIETADTRRLVAWALPLPEERA